MECYKLLIILGVLLIILLIAQCFISKYKKRHLFDKNRAPKPLISRKNITEPPNTTEIDLKWACLFSDNTIYDPQQISFRIRITNENYSSTKLFSYSESVKGSKDKFYYYKIPYISESGFASGTYQVDISSYVDDRIINPDPGEYLDPRTSNNNSLQIIIGGEDCQPSCYGSSCGDPDGCGGICDGKCEKGYNCINGECVKREKCSIEGEPCINSQDPESAGRYYCKDGECVKCPDCGTDEYPCPEGCINCLKNQKCGCFGIFGKRKPTCLCDDEGNCSCQKCPECGGPSECPQCGANADSCVKGKCRCGSNPVCSLNSDNCSNGNCYCGTGPVCSDDKKCVNGECKTVCCANNYLLGDTQYCCSNNGKCNGMWYEIGYADDCGGCKGFGTTCK